MTRSLPVLCATMLMLGMSHSVLASNCSEASGCDVDRKAACDSEKACESEKACDSAARATAPQVKVLTFHADWCGTCETLNPRISEVQQNLGEKPVLFVTLDLTDEQTRQQAELLASALGLDKLWGEYGDRTGFAVVVNGAGEVVSTLTVQQEGEQLRAAIAQWIDD